MFPIKRENTITRANIAAARDAEEKLIKSGKQKQPLLTTPEAVAIHFCGTGPHGTPYIGKRHVERARKLMRL